MSGLSSVVAGASGLIGGCLVRRLAEDEAFGEVTLLVRKEMPLLSPKLLQRVVDFGALSVGELGRPDVVFCALGTTIAKAGSEAAFRKVDLDTVVHLARAASEAGARQFLVVSSLGADPKASAFYLRVKGEMERELRAFPFEGLQLFRPSLLLGGTAQFRPRPPRCGNRGPPHVRGRDRDVRLLRCGVVRQNRIACDSRVRTGLDAA
jgi:uncharacterized protein YbjT (DUF2867 family)